MVVPCTRAGHQRLKRPPSLEKKGEKERIREETRRVGSNRAESYSCGGRGRGKSELGQPGRAAAPAYIASPNGRIQRSGGAGGGGSTTVVPPVVPPPLTGRTSCRHYGPLWGHGHGPPIEPGQARWPSGRAVLSRALPGPTRCSRAIWPRIVVIDA
jgi:hypothetical protein